jgi:hypothetical protein
MASVYRKTPKGLSEIETRANRLTPRLRTSLILVDGRRSDEQLRTMIQVNPDEVLSSLLTDGYIEVIAITPAPRPAAPATAGTATNGHTSGSAPRNLEDVRRQAVRFLNDHLGPSAESVALKIEKSNSWDELKPNLEMAEHFLRAGRGAATARDFEVKFLERPPT